jgi:hypothetical protein
MPNHHIHDPPRRAETAGDLSAQVVGDLIQRLLVRVLGVVERVPDGE